MTDRIVLDLPMPPSVNGLFRNTSARERQHMAGHGRPARARVKTARYRQWIEEAGWAARAARPGRILGPYGIHLCLSRAERGRSDAENRCKAVSDLLVSLGIVEDDRLAEETRISWGDVPAGCRVEITRAGA